jgi:DNA-binding protein HU-beta
MKVKAEILNQTDLIAELANENELTKVKTKELLESFAEIILKHIKKGKVVVLPVLGRMTLKHMAEKNGISPKTGKPIKIAARNALKFAASAQAKREVA